MMQITDVILIALFIEAIVNAIKPLWSKNGEKLSVSEYVSMGMGVLLAVACRINMLAYVVESTYPAWVEYVFYALTGIAIGRGTNFLYDIWGKLKELQSGKLLTTEIKNGIPADLEIAHWSLVQLQDFCVFNDIDMTGCKTREDFINAIMRGGRTIPPDAGGAE